MSAGVNGHDLASEDSARAVRRMFDRIARRYDTANHVMSAGVDLVWRRQAINRLLSGLPADARILDLGAGTLNGTAAIAGRARGAKVAGLDFARRMLQAGTSRLRGTVGERVDAIQGDARHLPYADAVFDGAFSAFCVRNIPDLDLAFSELRRVLRPGARLVLLEFFRSTRHRPFWDGFWNRRIIPLLGKAVSGDAAAYAYLPESIARFSTREEAEERLRSAGFSTVRGRDLFPGAVASLVEAT